MKEEETKNALIPDKNKLPHKFAFDVEEDIKSVRFSTILAERTDSYVQGLEREKQYRQSLKIQRSVNGGLRHFFKVKD